MERLTRFDAGGIVTGVKKLNGDFAGNQEMLIRLKEYEDLEEQNRLIRLPTRMNEICYVINRKLINIDDNSNDIFEYEIKAETISFMKVWLLQSLVRDNLIFATLEEAEQRLKELEG